MDSIGRGHLFYAMDIGGTKGKHGQGIGLDRRIINVVTMQKRKHGTLRHMRVLLDNKQDWPLSERYRLSEEYKQISSTSGKYVD